jgi:hypothetical protein
MSNDYIPTTDEAFLDWTKNLVSYTASHATAWGIAEEKLSAVQGLATTYETAFATAKDPNRGKADVLAKNSARNALKVAIRAFVKSYLAYNEAVSDEDRVKLGLPVHDKKPTPTPAPATYPDFDIDTSVLRQLTVHFRDAGSTRRGKPKGVHGAEIGWDFSETPVTDPNALSHSEFDTRTPHPLIFSGDDRGKRVYISVRWENAKGEKGPWGEITGAIVP